MKRPTLLPIFLACFFLAMLAMAAVTGRGIVHVRPGSFATTGEKVLPPGWHLTSPFSHAETLAEEGNGALPPLMVSSREGVRGTALLSFRYRADVAALTRAASGQEREFHALLERAASEALHECLAGRSAAEFLDRSALGPSLIAVVTRSLERIGMHVSDLQWEIRLPEEFRRNLMRREYASLARATGLRVFLIGLDAADWESIDPLIAAGRLPSLKRLIDAGIRSSLHSYNPMISPLLWTTAVTGKGPDVHGVADFTVVEAKTRRRIPISSRYRKVKALWNILTDFDRPSAVVGWWATYPADEVDGYLVSDRVAALGMLPGRDALADRPGYTSPASYLKQVLPRLPSPRQIPFDEVRRFVDITRADYEAGLAWIEHPPEPPKERNEKPPTQDPVGLLIKMLAAARSYQAVTRDLLGRGPFDLTAVYYEGIDLVGHRFQHYRPPRMRMVSEAEFRKYRSTVSEYYVFQDRLIGDLLEKAGPETTVMVLSDHGFKTGSRRPEDVLPYTMDQPVEWHREEGIFILSGPGARRGRLMEPATLFDITPTILALLGLPVAADMPGRVLEEAIDPGFLEGFPPGHIPTYEGVGTRRQTEEGGGTDEVSAEMIAQLRALGYLGGDVHAPGAPPEAAVTLPRTGASAEETPVTYHRNLATYYLSRRDYLAAIGELEEANRREKLPKSYAMLAEAFDALGKKVEAMAALEEGWKTVPDGMAADSILWFVELSAEQGDPARGRRFAEAHREALQNASATRDAVEGRLAESEGRRAEAERLYEKALAADPTLVVATKRLIDLYRQDRRMEAIRPVLEAGLKRSERIDEYHNLLGALESEAGRKEQALVHFRRARDLNPSDPRFPLNVGLTLMDLNRWEEAGKVFENAISSTPTSDLYLGLGNVRLRMHDSDGALAVFQRARELGGNAARAFPTTPTTRRCSTSTGTSLAVAEVCVGAP